MTTSGTYTFAMTARDIVTQAMREARILAAGEEPDSTEMADGILQLNGMLKSWQTEDSLWREDRQVIEIAAGEASVTLPSAIRSVTDVRLAQSATYQRPMQRWSRADYNQIPNKTVTGSPLAFYHSDQRDAGALFIWPVPSADAEMVVEFIRGVETVTDAGETLDVPDDWQEAVWTNLAVRLAGGFGSESSPELVARAADLYGRLLDRDRPESYFLGPWDDRYYA